MLVGSFRWFLACMDAFVGPSYILKGDQNGAPDDDVGGDDIDAAAVEAGMQETSVNWGKKSV